MMVDLPAGMRNNNPGNIKYVGQRNALGPSVNTDQGDPQAVYDSAETGMQAAYDLALRKYNAGKRSAAQLIAGQGGWTPGNSSAANNIARHAGLKIDEDLNLNDPVSARKFMRGLIRQEHGNASNAYTDDLLDSAYSKVTGGKVTPVNNIDIDSLANEFGAPVTKTETKSSNPEASKLREDADYYDKTNPNAAKEFRAKADALEASVTPAANTGGIDVDSLASEFGAPATKAEPAKAPVAEVAPVVPTKEGELNVNNAVRATARGVPIIGGLLNKANAATNAALAPIGNQFFSPADQLKGETFSERYANSLAQQEGQDSAFKAQNPGTNTGLEIAGAIGATIPVAATALGGRALGAVGETLAGRAAASSASGAAINAADTLIRTGDAGEAQRAAGTGAILGGAVPYVAAGAGALARKGMELASPVATRTANRLGQAFGLTGQNADEATIAAMKANPRLAAMDVDPNVGSIAQGLAVLPGESQNVLSKAVANRAGTSASTVKGVFDEALGDTPNVPALLQGMKDTARTNANKGFGEALKDAKPIELSDLKPNETDIVTKTWNRVVGDLPDPTKFSQPEIFHKVQSRLREEAEDLLSSAVGSERTAGKDLMALRNKIVDRIDEGAGGKFKPAQKQYADDMAVQSAFDKGTEILKNGNALGNRPDAWAKAFSEASDAEKEAIRLGARVAVDNFIGSSKNSASSGSRILDSEFNLDKLKLILGEKEALRLAKLLKDETAIAASNAKLTGGSQTQQRRELGDSIRPREVAPVNQNALSAQALLAGNLGFLSTGNVLGTAAAALPLAVGAGRNVAQRIGRAIDTRSNADIARIVSAPGEEGIAMLKQLSDRAASQNRLSGSVATGVNATSRSAIPSANAANEREPLMVTVKKKFTGGGG